jgi:hypothetical protein
VRLERTHAKLIGEDKGLLVVGFGLVDLWRITMCSDVTEEVESIRLITLLLLGLCRREDPLTERYSLCHAAG